jgi:hypothetical protein
VANVRIEAHDPGLHGLNEGDPGYAEAKSKILEKRLVDLAKSEYWLRAVCTPSLSLPFAFPTSLHIHFSFPPFLILHLPSASLYLRREPQAMRYFTEENHVGMAGAEQRQGRGDRGEEAPTPGGEERRGAAPRGDKIDRLPANGGDIVTMTFSGQACGI